jgi:hypothetical protein
MRLNRGSKEEFVSHNDYGERLCFSKDPKLLQEYFVVRERCYRLVKDGPKDFSGHEDAFDRNADILVVRAGDSVIGGARIVSNKLAEKSSIPLESEGFKMKNIFPDLDLNKHSYCEFGRLAVLPQYRSMALIEDIVLTLIMRAIETKHKYMFAMNPLVQARCYRKICKKLRLLRPYNIHTEIEIPQKPEQCGTLKMYLSSLELARSED